METDIQIIDKIVDELDKIYQAHNDMMVMIKEYLDDKQN